MSNVNSIVMNVLKSTKHMTKQRLGISETLGGPQPYVPVAGYEEDDEVTGRLNNMDLCGNSGYKRARVLCSYDAKDGTELNLTSNEVIFVCECNPPNSDYMNGKQGLLKGLVPKAFLELLDD